MKIILGILIISFFLYTKLIPYEGKLDVKYKRIFSFFKSIYELLLNFLRKFIKPFQVGNGISVDMAQVVFLLILLIISNWL